MVFSCFQAWVSLNCFSAEELAATCILPSLFEVATARHAHPQAIHSPDLFEVCSGALNEVLHWYYLIPQHQAVIDIVIPRIAQMQPLAKEAVESRDYDMVRRIVLIFIQLGNDYIIPVMDEGNQLKDTLLEVVVEFVIDG